MANVRRVLAFVLLLAGVTLVFLGLTRALGLTPLGVLVSVVAIAALLYHRRHLVRRAGPTNARDFSGR